MHFASLLVAAVGTLFSVPVLNSTSVTTDHCVTISRTLSLNTTGAEVVRLQQFLGVMTTGYFGPVTRNALVQWQLRSHLIATEKTAGAGVTGPLTRAALRCRAAQTTTQQSASTTVESHAHSSSTDGIVSKLLPATTSIPAANPPVSFSSGGSGSVNNCPVFSTPRPPASECAIGEWVLVNDEADCPALWDCQDPNAAE